MTDIPDDVIERAARAIADRWSGATHSDQPFDTLSAPTQNVMRWCDPKASIDRSIHL